MTMSPAVATNGEIEAEPGVGRLHATDVRCEEDDAGYGEPIGFCLPNRGSTRNSKFIRCRELLMLPQTQKRVRVNIDRCRRRHFLAAGAWRHKHPPARRGRIPGDSHADRHFDADVSPQ